MADLVALCHIQTDNGFKRYAPGDIIPPDTPMAAEWVASGAAYWRQGEPPEFAHGELKTAQPGRPGIAVGGEGAPVNLVGLIPKTEKRNRNGNPGL